MGVRGGGGGLLGSGRGGGGELGGRGESCFKTIKTVSIIHTFAEKGEPKLKNRTEPRSFCLLAYILTP